MYSRELLGSLLPAESALARRYRTSALWCSVGCSVDPRGTCGIISVQARRPICVSNSVL